METLRHHAMLMVPEAMSNRRIGFRVLLGRHNLQVCQANVLYPKP